jgi:hypothetical protein
MKTLFKVLFLISMIWAVPVNGQTKLGDLVWTQTEMITLYYEIGRTAGGNVEYYNFLSGVKYKFLVQ